MGCDADAQTTNQYNAALMDQKYGFMTAGKTMPTQAEQVGKDANGWPTNFSNTFGSDAGGYASSQGFGPYTMNPGDSIRIVVADCVSGINRDTSIMIAKNCASNNTASFRLPAGYKNGAMTTDLNEYKNAWVFSGKDSLFQTFRRALANYKSGYSIPQPPPPPDQFLVNSGGDAITLSWSKSAETWPHFNGYRIYRSQGRTDTTFTKIFECDKNDIVNTYLDKDPKRGFNYYYYIQTKDDGSTNPGDPVLNITANEPLVSSKYYTMTNNAGYLTRQAGMAMTKIDSNVVQVTKNIFAGNGSKSIFKLSAPQKPDYINNIVFDGILVYVKPSNGTAEVLQDASTYSVSGDTLVTFVTAPNNRDTVDIRVLNRVVLIGNNVEYVGDSIKTRFKLPVSVVDSANNLIYSVLVNIKGVRQIPSSYSVSNNILTFLNAPDKGDSINVQIIKFVYDQSTPPNVKRSYALSDIRIVPNPWNIRSRNIQFGTNDRTTVDRLAFYNLPPKCLIKIYTEVGDLVATINHVSTSGDDYWNSLTSSRQLVVSGLYIAYFEVTEDKLDDTGKLIYRKGDTIFKKFIIIR